jgi:hypothetical protein
MKHWLCSSTLQGNHMDDHSDWQQMLQEREQMTEEAFLRAKNGTATEQDWKWLAGELGLTFYTEKRNVYI